MEVVALSAEAVVVLGEGVELLAMIGALDGLREARGVPVEGGLAGEGAVGAIEHSGAVGDSPGSG